MDIVNDDSIVALKTEYHWNRYTDGVQRRASKGTDFTGTPDGFRKAGSNWCRRNGYQWRGKIEGTDSIVFTITEKSA